MNPRTSSGGGSFVPSTMEGSPTRPMTSSGNDAFESSLRNGADLTNPPSMSTFLSKQELVHYWRMRQLPRPRQTCENIRKASPVKARTDAEWEPFSIQMTNYTSTPISTQNRKRDLAVKLKSAKKLLKEIKTFDKS